MARAAGLIAVAEDLACELSLRPLLERILRRCTELLGCDAGSICSVDEAAGTYRKEADIGVACQSGRVFPLTEGMTGAVVARRGPIWFARYEDVPGGHVAPQERATLCGVIGVPLEWRGRIIGACIVFSRDEARVVRARRRRTAQLFAKHAAIALANARHSRGGRGARAGRGGRRRTRPAARRGARHARPAAGQHPGAPGQRRTRDLDVGGAAARRASAEASGRPGTRWSRPGCTLLGLAKSPLDGRPLDAALRAEAAWAQSIGRLEVRLVSAGPPVPVEPALAREVLRVAREALTNIVRHAQARSLRLGLLYETGAVSLLVQDDGQGFDPKAGWQGERYGLRAMTERASKLGATIEIDSVPGWGTRIRARFPYAGRREPRRTAAAGAGRRPAPVAAGRAGPAAVPGPSPVSRSSPRWATAPQAVDACRGAASRRGAGRPRPARPDGGPAGAPTGAAAADAARLAVVASASTATTSRSPRRCGRGPGLRGRRRGRSRAGPGRGGGRPGPGDPVRPRAAAAAPRAARRRREAALTEREREVRVLMEQGLPDKLIAERLVLSVKTVEKHVGAVLRKTGARNRTELARRPAGQPAGPVGEVLTPDLGVSTDPPARGRFALADCRRSPRACRPAEGDPRPGVRRPLRRRRHQRGQRPDPGGGARRGRRGARPGDRADLGQDRPRPSAWTCCSPCGAR